VKVLALYIDRVVLKTKIQSNTHTLLLFKKEGEILIVDTSMVYKKNVIPNQHYCSIYVVIYVKVVEAGWSGEPTKCSPDVYFFGEKLKLQCKNCKYSM